MRDCVFLVADKNMEATFEGFLKRDCFYHSLGCGEFLFDASQDLKYAAADNDPGLYTRGHEILRPYQSTHKHAVVVIDAEWSGAPEAALIRQKMSDDIEATGWSAGSFTVIVIDPELEMWIWQKNIHVAKALGNNSVEELMADTDAIDGWPENQLKPNRPKEVLETILKKIKYLDLQQFINGLQVWFQYSNAKMQHFLKWYNTFGPGFQWEVMMSRAFQYKTVQSEWLKKEGHRLDCGPYMSGAIEAREKLHSLSVPKDNLSQLTKDIFHAGREGRVWVNDPDHGVPFLGSSAILNADFSNLPLISKKQVTDNPKFTIHKGWTLITRSGTIGRMSYTRSDLDGFACSEHVMRVEPDCSRVLPGYLYAFLNSSFGVPLVISGTYGAIIQHIEPHHIAGLPVPRLGDIEGKAHALVQKASDNLTAFQKLITNATRQIFESSGISNPSKKEWFLSDVDKGFIIDSNELELLLRGWNHSRRANTIKREIRAGDWSPLGDLLDLEWLRWRVMFKRIFASPEHGIEVITQKPLFNLRPQGKWISRNYLLNHSPKFVVPDETILIAKQGTLGENELYCRCEFITGEQALRRAYSDHCMRLVVKNESIHPGYLFAFLRSLAGFRLLRSLSEGSKQQDLHWRTVPNLPIPRLSTKEELEIGEMVRRAYALKNEAIEYENQARKIVEQAIHEGAV